MLFPTSCSFRRVSLFPCAFLEPVGLAGLPPAAARGEAVFKQLARNLAGRNLQMSMLA